MTTVAPEVVNEVSEDLEIRNNGRTRKTRANRVTLRMVQLAAVSVVAWGVIYLLFQSLDFDVLYETDATAYLSASQDSGAYPPLELPGYPTLVALFRELLPEMSPKIYMQGISFVAYVLTVICAYLLFEHYKLALAFPGALLFALFPLEGVTYSVFPRVNSLMYLTVVASLLLYIKGYGWAAIAVMSFSLLTHKSVWPVILFVCIDALYQRRLKWWSIPFIFLPLAVYWLAGSFHHSDFGWLLDTSLEVKFESKADVDIPFFAGLITTFRNGFGGDSADLVKAFIVIANFALAAFLLFSRIWATEIWLLGVIIPSLLWPAILNYGELWTAIVYTHLIVLAFIFWLDRKKLLWLRSTALWMFTLSICAVSQIVWAVYIVHYFS